MNCNLKALQPIKIYVQNPCHSGVDYSLDYVFSRRLGLKVERVETQTSADVVYGDLESPGAIHIKDAGFFMSLKAKTDSLDLIEIKGEGDEVLLFPQKGADLSFDIVAAVFVMLSRYEEYKSDQHDNHGRFLARYSILYSREGHRFPLVDLWLKHLGSLLESRGFNCRTTQPEVLHTFDIDQVYACRGKPLHRVIGGALRDLLQGRAKRCFRCVMALFGGADMYDSYSYLSRLTGNKIAFLQVANSSPLDKVHSVENGLLQNVSKELLNNGFEIGLHPSYRAEEEELIEKESDILNNLIGQFSGHSRQHFLRMRVPNTLEYLADKGILREYSMGWPDDSGFRAGSSRPFPFYSLSRENSIDLTVVPFCMMDTNLRRKYGGNTELIKREISELVASVRHSGGIFVSLWHNESLGSDPLWKGWKEIHEHMLKELSDGDFTN